MNDVDIFDELTVLFSRAGKTHQEAFVDAAGADPEWPIWYAEHLVDRLNELLDTNMTKSELCYLMVSADCERRTVAPGVGWHAHFARFFADRYA